MQISEQFRSAYLNLPGWNERDRDRAMIDSSKRGVEVLRILALGIRGDQDFGLTSQGSESVGALRASVSKAEVAESICAYRPPYHSLLGYASLPLRGALNKIAHADPLRSSFFASREVHDLVLTGIARGEHWVAIVSLPDLCKAIQLLPDCAVGH